LSSTKLLPVDQGEPISVFNFLGRENVVEVRKNLAFSSTQIGSTLVSLISKIVDAQVVVGLFEIEESAHPNLVGEAGGAERLCCLWGLRER